MIELTPAEANEYETGGLMGAIRAFRQRTNLGLMESKMAVEQWVRDGKPVARDGKMSLEEQSLAKLSDALTRARKAEDEAQQMKLKVSMIIAKVMKLAEELPQDQQDTWYRACGRMDNEIRNGLTQ